MSAIHRNRDDLKGLTELCMHSTLSQEKNYPGNFVPNWNCMRQFFPVFLAVIFLLATPVQGVLRQWGPPAEVGEVIIVKKEWDGWKGGRSRQEEGLMGVQAKRTSPLREYHTLKPWLLNPESLKFVTQCQCWTIIMWNSLIMPNHAWTLCQKKLLYFTLRMLKGLNNKSNHFRLLEKKCCKQPILWEFVSWFLLTTENVNSLACPYSAGHSTYLHMPD